MRKHTGKPPVPRADRRRERRTAKRMFLLMVSVSVLYGTAFIMPAVLAGAGHDVMLLIMLLPIPAAFLAPIPSLVYWLKG